MEFLSAPKGSCIFALILPFSNEYSKSPTSSRRFREWSDGRIRLTLLLEEAESIESDVVSVEFEEDGLRNVRTFQNEPVIFGG